MKKMTRYILILTSLCFSMLISASAAAFCSDIQIMTFHCPEFNPLTGQSMSRGGDPVQEVVVTGVRPYTPPSAGPGYLVSPNTGPVYRGPANGNAALQQICSNIEVTFSSCNLNAQNMYTQNTSNCRYGVVGGAIVGGIGITGATMMTGGWALLPLGIGGIGAGTTAWGASSCYNDQVSIRDSNYAICTSNLAKDKRMCGQ